MDRLAEYRYESAAEAAAIRTSLRETVAMAGLSGERCDDVALMASELMANTLRHTDTPQPRLTLDRTGEQLRVTVTDRDCSHPAPLPQDPSRSGGNGLRIIDVLADRWGTRHHDGLGKSVWFTIALPAWAAPPAQRPRGARSEERGAPKRIDRTLATD
ncbi:ATP-binding protein [Aquihabitans sp. G128]|uniref:ATP-binding protein n=1 Tax=Aquihabitans sp. G128 TaxID=2849779 RepID=UPI001C219443|nr:ATP-binding protein [Aquihabitans sp. G128]QXC62216.1 ATP-binding protein [Aquihabitans sp. G128]